MSDKQTQAGKAATKSFIKTGLKIAFAIGLIYWLVQQGALDFEAFARLASPVLIGICGALVFLQIFVNNFRWLTLMRGQGFDSSVRQTLPLSLIGVFFNFAMPGGVGGDVVKGYYLLQDHPQQKFAGAVSIFMDRMLGFFIMIAMAFLALFLNWTTVSQNRDLMSIAVGVTVLFFGFFAFYFLSLSRLLQNSWLGRFLFESLPGGTKLKLIYEALHSYRKAPWALILAAILSFLNQMLVVAFVYVIAQALSVDLPLAVYFFVVPLGLVAQALPISPAGIGVGQAAFYFLFNIYLGKESPVGPTAVTTLQIMFFFWGLLGAYFYLQRKKPLTAAIQS